MYRCLHGTASLYLIDSCTLTAEVTGRQHLRSVTQRKLVVPRYGLNCFGRRRFSVASPSTWNSLPDSLPDPELSLDTFKLGLCSCSEEAVRQLVSEAAVDSLVAVTSHTDTIDVANSAVSLLLSVASHAPNLRPYLGRAGAVEYFVHRLEEEEVSSDGTLPYKYLNTVDALCQCCRDANNQIKIREQGGLPLLINLLSNSGLENIHDRIISALVCFIYDDASIAVLLHNRLVPTLVSHLYHAAGIAKRPDFIGLDSFDIYASFRADLSETAYSVSEYLDDDLVITTADQSTSFPLHTEVKQNSDLLSRDYFVDFSIGNDSTDTAVLDTSSAVGTLVVEADQLNDDDPSEDKLVFVGDEPVVSEPVETVSKPSCYSINSPTYKAVSAWRMELAADKAEDKSTGGGHSPRNIWEGALLYAEHFSSAAVCPGSVSPASSCSDGLHSVRSWSSSLCGTSSPQKSPGVSPAWSLDSAGSGMYSPFSNSSYVYADGACSPLSFSDVDEVQLVSVSGCQCSDDELKAAAASHISGSQAHCYSVIDAHSETSVNEHLAENAVSAELPAYVIDACSTGQQRDNIGTSDKLLSRVNGISEGGKIDGDVSTAQSKLEDSNEEGDSKDERSDDEFDVESFQRRRQDERKFSRLFDIAQTMYASIETDPPRLASCRTKKRRRSSGDNARLSVRRKLQCTDVAAEVNNKSCTTDASDLEALPSEDVQNSGIACDNNCDAQSVPQSVQGLADDASSSEVGLDTETATSDTSSACSARCRNIGRVTERNILTLLSRISHSTETVAHMLNAGTVCGLLDYTMLVDNPLPAAGKTLLRLSRCLVGFQRAVLCLFPLHAAWRMEPDWLSDNSRKSTCFCQGHQNDICVNSDLVNHTVSGEGSQSFMQERSSKLKMTGIFSKRKGNHSTCSISSQVSNSGTKSDETERSQKCVVAELCGEIIANLSVIAISGYGQGEISHMLLRGSRRQREICVISLCILCRNSEMRVKYLAEMGGVDILMMVIRSSGSPFFPAAVLALSHLARSLPLSTSDSAWLEDSYFISERGGGPTVVDAAEHRCDDGDDLIFVLDDGSLVSASRRVMSRSSDVFAAMLSGSFRESTERRIRIRDAESGAFRTLVTWLHAGAGASPAAPAPLDELCELARLFHCFQVPEALLRRALLPSLVAAAFHGNDAEGGGNLAGVYRLLSTYDDAGGLRRDCVVSVFVRQMSLRRRCAAVASIVADCDTDEFVSILAAAFLDAIKLTETCDVRRGIFVE